MRIGTFISDTGPNGDGIDRIVETAQWAEDAGLHGGWLPYVPWSFDAMVTHAVVARETSIIELGTAVVPTYPFHPQAMARAALSLSALAPGRVTLGIGPSHPSVIERMYGLSYERAGVHTREYVDAVLDGFAQSGTMQAHGDFYDFTSMFSVPGSPPAPSVLVAALAPYMLRLAGERADGTILWLTDEHALEHHVRPRITDAAHTAGRPAPRIVLGMPIAICDDVAEGKAAAASIYATYRQIPTYARIMEHAAVSAPEDIVLVGPESVVRERLRRYAELGTTDLLAAPFAWGDDRERIGARTRDFLASIATETT